MNETDTDRIVKAIKDATDCLGCLLLVVIFVAIASLISFHG